MMRSYTVASKPARKPAFQICDFLEAEVSRRRKFDLRPVESVGMELKLCSQPFFVTNCVSRACKTKPFDCLFKWRLHRTLR
jgi:hypothetical protein